MEDRLEELRERAYQGADMSPGDPVAEWAVLEIETLREKLEEAGLMLERCARMMDEMRKFIDR